MDEIPITPEREKLNEALNAMIPLFDAAGVPKPDVVANVVPEVYLKGQVRDLAIQYGGIMRNAGMYMLGETPVTIDEGDGNSRPMTCKRFVSFTEDWLRPWAYDKQHMKKSQSISPQTADVIMCSDHFRVKMPKLNGVNLVKLPVLQIVDEPGSLFHGKPQLRLLPQGYDAATGIFTVRGGIDYDENMPVDKAIERLKKLFKYFQFGDDGRSLAVHISALLTVFCAGMMPSKARPPMFAYVSNVPGSGKSQLARMALLLVHGRAGHNKFWERQEDFAKELDSAAQYYEPFLFFDNLTGYIKNDLLDGWLTSAEWAGRIIGTRERFKVPLRAVTFITGNNIRWSSDLKRRVMVVDLYPTAYSSDRVLPADAEEITDEWCVREEVRGELLACLYALVRNYYDPAVVKEAFQSSPPLASFEAWSRLIPPIVQAAKFSNPLAKPVLPDVGNSEEDDCKLMMERAIRDYVLPEKKSSVTVTLPQLCCAARKSNAFLEILGTVEETMRELDMQRGGYPKWDFVKTGGFTNSLGIWQDTTEVERRAPESEAERFLVAAHFMSRKEATWFAIRIRKVLGWPFVVDGGRWIFADRESARLSSFVFRQDGW